jgi:hypothetical protein
MARAVAAIQSSRGKRWVDRLNGNLRRILLKNSLVTLRLNFVELNLQGSDLIKSWRERAAGLLGEIFCVRRDPFVLKMRNPVQRASEISRLGQIGVFNSIGEKLPIDPDA